MASLGLNTSSMCIYGGLSSRKPIVELRALSIVRRRLYPFTGCTCIPLDGFEPAFTIVKSSLQMNSPPTSHTCFNQLVLPEFSSREELEERLSFALQHSTDGFQMS